MKYEVLAKKIKIDSRNFYKKITYNNKVFKQTKRAIFEFSFHSFSENELHRESIVIESELNLLPLFYESQSEINEFRFEINCHNIELSKPFFNLIEENGSKVDSLSQNYKFLIESCLFKFLVFKNHISMPSIDEIMVKSCYLVNDIEDEAYLDSLPKNAHLKIKIGLKDREKENRFLREYSNGHLIRLDSNRNLSINQLMDILNEVNLDNIEYIEEPFENVFDYLKFPFKDKIKLALDESLTSENFDDILLKLKNHVSFLVLKPNFNCSISDYFSFISKNVNENCDEYYDLIISSSYEFEDSLNLLLILAGISNNRELAHGLGTLAQMVQENFFNPTFDQAIIYHPFSFNKKLLK